jgi:DNA-binding NtrC family response regulator
MPHALLIDDDPSVLSAFAELIEAEGFETSVAGNLTDARKLIEQNKDSIDVVLCDLVLPDGSGTDLLQELDSSTQFIVITGHASVDNAVQALRLGVADYLTKPVDIARLKAVLGNIRRTLQLRDEIGTLRGELRKLGRFGDLIGASPVMQELYDRVSRVAPTEATVLLTGESGTGKDVVAQTLHALSRRSKGPFWPLNCGAVSPTLIESDLFGHERGSFTGAERMHKGYFERAHGGTLFLDEITEMPVELQVKLLRVLETGKILRVGGEKPIEIDTRVIAATNRDPQEAVGQGKLREDLLYRLRVFPISLPPLRARGDDVELLANHFLKLLNEQGDSPTKKAFTRDALQKLRSYAWPGNVRELKNLVHQAFILADQDISPACLPMQLRGSSETAGGNSAPVNSSPGDTPQQLSVGVGTSLAEADRRLILATLEEFGGNKRKTAAVLGISLKTLYNRLNEYRDSK